ncbi:putative ceramide kinase [Helianthus anomalus]
MRLTLHVLLLFGMLKDQMDRSTCLGVPIMSKHDTSIKISDDYVVEFIDWGLVHDTLLTNPRFLLGHNFILMRAYSFCTTGVRDPMMSVPQIILGKRVCLDIVQVVRWDKSHASKNEPHVRYAASFEYR